MLQNYIGREYGNEEETWEVLEILSEDEDNPQMGDCAILYSDDNYEYIVIPYTGKEWIILLEDFTYGSNMMYHFTDLGNLMTKLRSNNAMVSGQFYVDDDIVEKIIESDDYQKLVIKYVLKKKYKR